MNKGNIYIWEPETDKGYSIGWNLQTLIEKGLPDSNPPQSSDQLLKQITELTKKTKTEWSGPVTYNSLDNCLVPFLAEEKPTKLHFIQQIEEFLEEIAKQPVTITLDLIPRPELKHVESHQIILDAVNDVLLQVYRSQMNKGKISPNIVVNLYPETDWTSKSLNSWLELSYLYGEPIYQNFITGTISPETPRPRKYKPEKEVTYLRLGGPNGDSEDQATTGYTCINLAKLGQEAKNEDHFFQLADQLIEEAVKQLKIKHEKIFTSFNNGDKPVTAHFMENIDWGFSVITLVGMNEALESLIDAPMGHVAGKAVTYKLLEHLLRKIEYIQEETGLLLSLESYPSETPGAVLLTEYESDHNSLTASTELNSSHGNDLWDALEHQKKFHSLYTGGTLQQIHLEHALEYNDGLRLLVKRAIENFGYNYLAITPIFSLCPEHGYVKGDNNCPICGEETKAYTRIDGKMTLLSRVHESLKEAYWRRVYYDVKNK